MRFTNIICISAAIVCLAMAPAYAEYDGFVSGGLGGNTISGPGESLSSPLLQGRGSATVWLTPTLSVQGDVVLQYQSYNSNGGTQTIYHTDGALHLSYRDSERFLAGGFIQLGNEQFVVNGSNYPNSPRTFAGVEAQAYLGDVTLYGQVGAARINILEEVELNGLFATGEIRYFLTPNFKIDAHGSVIKLNFEANDVVTINTYGIGVGAEYRLEDSPLSFFGSLDYFRNDFSAGMGSINTDNTRVLVGMKFNFGSETLQDRDRNGTTLNPVAQFPLFIPIAP